MTTVLTCAERGVGPEIFHRLRKVLHDVLAVEDLVVHERLALLAVEDEVLGLAVWPPLLHHKANGVRSAARRVNDIWRNEEHFAFLDDIIANAPVLDGFYNNVALELKEEFLAIDLMKIIARVRTHDDHHEEVATGVKILVRHRRLEVRAVRHDPREKMEGGLHASIGVPAVHLVRRVWIRDGRSGVRQAHA